MTTNQWHSAPTIALMLQLLQKQCTPNRIQHPHLGKFQSWHRYQPPCVHLRRGRLHKKREHLGNAYPTCPHSSLARLCTYSTINQCPWHPRVPSPLLIGPYHPQVPPFDFQKLHLIPCLLPHDYDIISKEDQKVLTPPRASICTHNMKYINQYLLNRDWHHGGTELFRVLGH